MTKNATDKFARQLIECLHKFGADHSNPVLHLLECQRLVEKTRYPEQALSFGNDWWRVFYHCHDADDQHGDEHGHFHFFTRNLADAKNKSDWSHVVALSVDNMGQPLQWFMVNQWVTGSEWFLNEWFDGSFSGLAESNEEQLLQKWFQAMLCLYREEIAYLLRLRDKNFGFLCNKADLKSCFQDKDIYMLAVEPIALIEKLQASLNMDVKLSSQDDIVA